MAVRLAATMGILALLGCLSPNAGAAGSDWKAAEQVARDWVKARDGKAPSKVSRDLAPYAFSLRRADGSWTNVLVHGGKVVEERGLGALAAYLRDERFLEKRGLTQEQLLSLIELLAAWPPSPAIEQPQGYLAFGPLAPKLEWTADGGAVLRLHYPPSGNVGRDMPTGVAQGPTGPRPTTRAQLALPAGYTLAWTVEAGPPQ